MTNSPHTTFDMEVVTSKNPQAFVETLFQRINVQARAVTLEGMTQISTEYFDITTFDGARDAISSDLGIEPTVFIEFRPKATLDTEIIAIRRLLQALDKWLHFIGNDFVLTYNGADVMMYRKDCQLVINEACEAWTPARLSLLTFPFSVVNMPAVHEIAEE
jgi:hypothetical protein